MSRSMYGVFLLWTATCGSLVHAQSLWFDAAQISQECVHEWQLREWRIGEDRILASQLPLYRQAIEQMCSASARLYLAGEAVSPYVHHSQRVVLPFIYSRATPEQLEQWLKDIYQNPDFLSPYVDHLVE